MALGRKQIAGSYPLPAYNYRVTILDLGPEGTCVIGFSEVSGLNTEYEPVTYKHGLSFFTGPTLIPGMRQPTRLTFKKGLTQGGDYLYRWMDKTYADPLSPRVRRDVVIDLCDETGKSAISWTARGVLPTKLEGPSFVANAQEVAISQMELLARDLRIVFQQP